MNHGYYLLQKSLMTTKHCPKKSCSSVACSTDVPAQSCAGHSIVFLPIINYVFFSCMYRKSNSENSINLLLMLQIFFSDNNCLALSHSVYQPHGSVSSIFGCISNLFAHEHLQLLLLRLVAVWLPRLLS